MENSSLIKLLSVLNENEIRLIGKKLKTLERNELLVKLFNHLKNNINKPNKILKKNVLEAVFVNLEDRNDQKITKLKFQLFHFIESEVLFNFLTADDTDTAKFSSFFKVRALHNFYATKNESVSNVSNNSIAFLKQKKLLEMKQLVENIPIKSEIYFLNKSIISNELYFGHQIQNHNHLEVALKNLDLFYCLAKMKIGAEIGQLNLLKPTPTKNHVFEEVLKFSENLEYNNSPLIKIYQVIGLLYQKVKFKNLKLLKQLIFKNALILSKEDLGYFIGILNNFTISGQLEQTNELFLLKYQVLKFGFDNSIFIKNGIIRPEIILNYSFICFRLKKVVGLKKALNSYSLLLEKKFKYKIQKLCEAYINILEKNYMPAFNILDNNSFLPFNMLAKALRLRCVYELEISKVSYFDGSLYDESLVFKRYLNRQLNAGKISKGIYNSFMNLANFLLDVINPAYTKEELFEMLNGKYESIRYKNWCKEKINKLA